MTSSHRVPPFTSFNSLLTLLSWILQCDIWVLNEGNGEKGNILRWKLERIFLNNVFVMCEFISQIYTYVSFTSPLTLPLRNLRRASLDRIESYTGKGNIISSQGERTILKNFSLICEFISQCYTLDLRKQFANTLFVESAKWYLGAHRGPLW